MKKKMLLVLCLNTFLLFLLSSTVMAAYIEFDAFSIRSGGTIVEHSNGSVTYSTPNGGQKAGYGTNYFDNQGLGSILSVDFNTVSGPSNINPYLNIWVTDGTNYAVISSENDYRGTDLQTRNEWKVFETDFNSLDWLAASGTVTRDGSQYLNINGSRATLGDLASNAALTILDPGTYLSPLIGTGAPKGGYGFNIIWGDTATNYLGVYSFDNLSINGELVAGNPVPEPATMILFGIGLMGLAGINRRKK